MSEKPRILYVEDDISLGFVTRDNLEMEGYEIVHCTTGGEAMQKILEEHFDLCILDVMLPEIDGFDLAKAIREKDQEVPILFLSAKSLKEDRLKGLRLGADDYLTKPFSIEELLLKIDIFLRRRRIVESHETRAFKLGKYQFDYTNVELSGPSGKRNLTSREAEVLRYLAERPNVVLRRSDILTSIWGKDDYFLGRSLDVFISRLRKYLKEDPSLKIENIHAVGFKFVLPE